MKRNKARFRTHLVRPIPHRDPVDVRQPGVFHDFASFGVSEPVLRLEREQPRDEVFEGAPPGAILWPFVTQGQDVVEYRLVTVPLEWLNTKWHTLDNPS